MAKIKLKSKSESKKKAGKSAALKCRTATSPTKKTAACGKVGRSKVKTTLEPKAARKLSCSAKVSKISQIGKIDKKVVKTTAAKTTAKKTTVARTATVKKRVSPAKAVSTKAVSTKVAPVTRPVANRPTPIKPSIHPLERSQVSTDELRKMLLERRKGLLKNFDDEIAKFPEEDLKPVVVGDVADLAQDSSENELSFRLAEVESRELGKINKALEKINEGTYGVCEKCGDPISRARLKALPFASKCIRCQAEDEQNVWYS